MRRIIQFSSRLTRRRYDTCAIRLVAPASNEPYIQYRACKREKFNKNNMLTTYIQCDSCDSKSLTHAVSASGYITMREKIMRDNACSSIEVLYTKKSRMTMQNIHENADYEPNNAKRAQIRVPVCCATTSWETRISATATRSRPLIHLPERSQHI